MLRVTRERQGRRASQNRSSAKPIFTPEFVSPRLQTEHQTRLRCLRFFSNHSFKNPSKLPSASRRIKHIWSSNDSWQIFVCRPQTVTPAAHCLTASNQSGAVGVAQNSDGQAIKLPIILSDLFVAGWDFVCISPCLTS